MRQTRIRIHTEEKKKVVAAVLGTSFVKFLATLDIFQQDDFKNRDELILFFISSWCLLFCLNPSSMAANQRRRTSPFTTNKRDYTHSEETKI